MPPAPPLSPWTGPVIFTLVTSCLALAVAICSIGWQVYSWRHSGPTVRVEASYGVSNMGPSGSAAGFIAVQAVNSGRLETTISGFGFKVKDKGVILSFESYLKTVELPARLGPGESLDYWYEPDDIDRQLATNGLTRSALLPMVKTGHGTIYGKPLK